MQKYVNLVDIVKSFPKIGIATAKNEPLIPPYHPLRVVSTALNAEEIARSQIAAAAGVVRHLLGHK